LWLKDDRKDKPVSFCQVIVLKQTKLAGEGYLAATTLNRFDAATNTKAKLFVDDLKIMEPKQAKQTTKNSTYFHAVHGQYSLAQ